MHEWLSNIHFHPYPEALTPCNLALFNIHFLHKTNCTTYQPPTLSFIASNGILSNLIQKEAFIIWIFETYISPSIAFNNTRFLSKDQGPFHRTRFLSLLSSKPANNILEPNSLKTTFLIGCQNFYCNMRINFNN